MLQGYSGKHWVQIPRKQAVFVHSWYSQSSPWEWREDEVYYVQRGCCRYVQSFIIMFFFLTSRSSPRVFFREKDIRLFYVFAFLPLRNRGCHQPVELGVNSPSVHVYLNDFQFICHFASVAVNFECGGLSFFATLSKVEKKLNKIGTLKKFEMRFWKKKKERIIIFQMFFILTGNTWPSPADRRVAAGAPSCCVPSFLLLLLEMFSFVLQCSSLADYKSSEHLLQQLSSFRFALISSPRFLNFYFSKNVETKMKKGKAGTSCRNLPFSE